MEYIRRLAVLLLTLFMLSLMQGTAQKLSKFYHSSRAPQGVLYFVRPHKVPTTSPKVRKPMEVDYTYINSRDSVVMLATIYTSQPTKIDLMTLGDDVEAFLVSCLYQEPKGKMWEVRIRVRLPYSLWRDQMSKETPPIYDFRLGSGAPIFEFQDTGRQWRKRRELYRKFFAMLDANPYIPGAQ